MVVYGALTKQGRRSPEYISLHSAGIIIPERILALYSRSAWRRRKVTETTALQSCIRPLGNLVTASVSWFVPTSQGRFCVLKRPLFPNFSCEGGINGTAGFMYCQKPLHESTIYKRSMSSNGKPVSTAGDKEEFLNFFPQIVKALTEDDLHTEEVADALNRLKEVLEYNAVGGKYNRGLTVKATFQELMKAKQPDPKSLQIALVVGWCVELLQAFFLVADDIMDSSVTRRGQPCWYRKEGIGLDAVNDAFLLEASIFRLLRLHCRDQPYYKNLMELFLQTSYQTELGQVLDLLTAPPNNIDLSRFTEQRYKAIVKNKTAYYSFYLPVAAAMYMAGIDSEDDHDHAKKILLEMGEFFQIQDDFLDCFGDPEVTGKIGTDIQDNKCSWLVIQSLKKATPEQRKILEENYGQKDMAKVALVKALYEEMDLKGVYREYEEKSYQNLSEVIRQHTGHVPSEVFFAIAKMIYKREK